MAKAAAVQHVCTECGTRLGPLARALPGLRRVRHAGRGARRAPRRRAAVRAAPLLRLVDVERRGDRPDPDRRPRARPGARRRPRARLARARRRGARGRQVDAAAGGARRDLADAPRAARHRRGVGRAGQAARGPARRLRAGRDPRRDRARRRLRDARARAARRLRDRLGADALLAPRSARRPARSSQVREAAARLLRVCQGVGRRDLPRRPRDEGRLASPGRACSSTSSTASCSSRATATTPIASCARPRTASARPTSSRVFEMTGAGPRRRARPLGDLRPQRARARSAPRSPARSQGTRPLLLEIQSLVAPTDLAMPRRVGTGVDPKRLAMIVAVLARHAGPAARRRRRVRQRRGRRAHRRARRRPRDRARDRLGGRGHSRCARGSAAFGEIGLTGRLRAGHAGRAAGRGVPQARSQRRCSRRPGTEGAASRPRRFRRALAAGLSENTV